MIYLFIKIYKKAPHNVQKKISLQKRKYIFFETNSESVGKAEDLWKAPKSLELPQSWS